MLRAFDVVAIMAAEAENKSAETFIVVFLLLADACCYLRGCCFAFALSSVYFYGNGVEIDRVHRLN